MWYFAWILGLPLAAMFAVLNAMWLEMREDQRIIKAEMSKRGTKYQDLSDRLAQAGIHQSADNLRNKVNKGIMGADLLLQIMYVLNMRKIERDEILDIFADLGRPLE